MAARRLLSPSRGVLCIGTTETANAVGLGLDARLLAARRLAAWTIVTAVSAQDAGGVRALSPLPVATVAAQLACVDPQSVGAIRIGALPSAAAIVCVIDGLRRFAGVPAVLDPVLSSSRGGALATGDTVPALRDLAAHVTIVLPNLAEAAALAEMPVGDEAEALAAAERLTARGARAVLVTGGHLTGDPTDVLVTAERVPHRFRAPRIEREMRGTGCTLAVSLAAELAETGARANLGDAALVVAIERARATVRTTIAHARRVGDQWVAA